MQRYAKALLSMAAFALFTLVAAHTAQADPIAHVGPTGQTTFNQVAPNTHTNAFGSADNSPNYQSSLTVAGVSFTGGGNYMVNVIEGTNVGAPGNYVLTSNTNTPNPQGPNIIITPPSNTFAFAFDIKSSNSALGTLGTGAYQIFVNGSAAPLATVNPTYSSFSFVGFTSDVPITSITIAGLSGGDPVLDNIRLDAAAPAEVPEPATLVLLGTGLAGAAGAARKRRRNDKHEAPDERDA